MKKELNLNLLPEIAFDESKLNKYVLKIVKATSDEKIFVRTLRRSIDARKKKVKVNVKVEILWDQPLTPLISYSNEYNNVSNAPEAIIVGSGPAGLFAALRLIELGVKPIILERGKDVRARRRDIAAINKEHIVNPNSNYCFGEGGAGTYSDGKLYTRSKKRGDFRKILEVFVTHGASEEILIDKYPHIGTNKLPKIISAIRKSILDAGGAFHFNEKVIEFIIKNRIIQGVKTAVGHIYTGVGVILATGHSARDIFQLLHKQKITIESKPFALGVRVEHAQSLIDSLQYHGTTKDDYLPAATYSLVSQVNYKGLKKAVLSFCMCPGGFIVPSATNPGEVVVNGMSPSKRDSKFSNSGIVVPIDKEDLQSYKEYGIFAGLEFQKEIERKACEIAGGNQTAPAQLLQDFVNKKESKNLLDCSYQPGLKSVMMDDVLPKQIAFRLRIAFQMFGKKMKRYLTNEAQILGVESRTSSPIKIPRNKESYEHINMPRLFPCGEGAGYAGGIASAAMDGEKCAESLVKMYVKV